MMLHHTKTGVTVVTRRVAAAILTVTSIACYAGSGKIDACKLLSAADAGKVLGRTVTVKSIDTSAAGPDAASMCGYHTGEINGGFIVIEKHVTYSDAAHEVAEQKKMATRGIPPGIPKPTFSVIQGLGDAAYLLKSPGSFQLHVLAHQTAIVIGMNRDATHEAIVTSQKIARIALDNLKKASGD